MTENDGDGDRAASNVNDEAPALRRQWNALQDERQALVAETAAIEFSQDATAIQDHRARLYAHNCQLYALWQALEQFHMRRGSIKALVPESDVE